MQAASTRHLYLKKNTKFVRQEKVVGLYNSATFTTLQPLQPLPWIGFRF